MGLGLKGKRVKFDKKIDDVPKFDVNLGDLDTKLKGDIDAFYQVQFKRLIRGNNTLRNGLVTIEEIKKEDKELMGSLVNFVKKINEYYQKFGNAQGVHKWTVDSLNILKDYYDERHKELLKSGKNLEKKMDSFDGFLNAIEKQESNFLISRINKIKMELRERGVTDIEKHLNEIRVRISKLRKTEISPEEINKFKKDIPRIAKRSKDKILKAKIPASLRKSLIKLIDEIIDAFTTFWLFRGLTSAIGFLLEDLADVYILTLEANKRTVDKHIGKVKELQANDKTIVLVQGYVKGLHNNLKREILFLEQFSKILNILSSKYKNYGFLPYVLWLIKADNIKGVSVTVTNSIEEITESIGEMLQGKNGRLVSDKAREKLAKNLRNLQSVDLTTKIATRYITKFDVEMKKAKEAMEKMERKGE